MWLMLERDEPTDYVIATGRSHSVRDLCRIAFTRVNLDFERHVVSDPGLYRPADVEHLRGDSSKAWTELGWQPEVEFEGLVEMMVDADLARIEDQLRSGRLRRSAPA
jgi:GDPmannose 4,6-dehydratase